MLSIKLQKSSISETDNKTLKIYCIIKMCGKKKTCIGFWGKKVKSLKLNPALELLEVCIHLYIYIQIQGT